MVKISSQIWLGNILDSENEASLKTQGVSAILNVAAEANARELPGIYYIRVNLSDVNSNLKSQYKKALMGLEQMIEDEHTVLVHCMAGQSRRPAIVAGYLMLSEALDPYEAIYFVVSKKPDVVPNWDHLDMIASIVEEHRNG